MAETETKTPGAEKAAPAEKTAKFKALTYIEHDQVGYDVGAPISLTAAQAQPLLDVKAIEPAGTKAAADA